MFFDIITTVIFYLILMFLSVNLLGLFVRGFVVNPELEKLESETKCNPLKKEIKKLKRSDQLINFTAFLSIFGYLYSTFHFWNFGVTAIAIILMLIRLPDLLWEIKTRQEYSRITSTLSIPRNLLSYITSFFTFLLIPVLYFFLYRF